MPANTVPIFSKAARWGGLSLTHAAGTALQALFTAGTYGSRVEAIAVSSSDTATRDAFLWVALFDDQAQSQGSFPLGHVAVPAHAGNDGSTPAVALLNDVDFPFITVDREGNRYLDLPPAAVLQVRVGQAVTSGNQVAPNLNYVGSEPMALSFTVFAQDY